jgi:hypothetical protein
MFHAVRSTQCYAMTLFILIQSMSMVDGVKVVNEVNELNELNEADDVLAYLPYTLIALHFRQPHGHSFSFPFRRKWIHQCREL